MDSLMINQTQSFLMGRAGVHPGTARTRMSSKLPLASVFGTQTETAEGNWQKFCEQVPCFLYPNILSC